MTGSTLDPEIEREMRMPTAKELRAQVNELRQAQGLKPYAESTKKTSEALGAELAELRAKASPEPPPKEKATKPTEFTVMEELDEDALIQPKVPETIKAMSYRLLQHVHRVDETDKRTVGLLYSTIVALVRKKFPKAETSLECLRWYSVHMRQEGIRLPQKRPRPLTRI